MKYLSSKEASDILGVNISTLKRWTETGKLNCLKTAGGHRKFTIQHIRNFYKDNKDSVKSKDLSLKSKHHKAIYGLINKVDYKQLSSILAQASLNADEEAVSNIINGSYMNGLPIADILDYLIEVAGYIVEKKLENEEISHADAYLSRKLITRTVDSLNSNKPNGSFNGKNALCVNFEDNLPDIGVIMSEVLLRHNGYNVFNTGSHAQLGNLQDMIKERKIDLLLFYLCDMQCCNAIIDENIKKTSDQVKKIIKLSETSKVKVIFGGMGLSNLKEIKPLIDRSFLTFNNLQKFI
ncbi:MAG: MerR family transcriptional regulator [Flavobacteriaceae bacterium TMED121]|nr:hypothetical protein [Candidatus Neomarinimicrobiota bacterium]RPG67424.1 MAG: MerR family transcriptional regulator [Flavobacteriaceae bacterium TMED121]